MTQQFIGLSKRLGVAFANLFIPLQTAVILFYFGAKLLGFDDFFVVHSISYIIAWLFLPLLVLLPLALWRRSKVLVGMTGVVAVIFLAAYGPLFLPKQPLQTSAPAFTVMSYNVLFANQNLDETLANIRAHDPDIVALHEYTAQIAAQIDDELTADYAYQHVENGRGLYSRYPIEAYEFMPMPGSFGGGAQKAWVNIAGNEVLVMSVHPVRPPIHTQYVPGLNIRVPLAVTDTSGNDSQIAAIIEDVARTEEPLVLVGDFNLTDQNPAYDELTQFVSDAFVERGTGMGFTFTPFSNYAIPVWRIDYVFHSDEITAVDIEVGDFAGSDHKPLIATLAVAESNVVEK